LVSYCNNTSSKQIPFPPPSLSAHPSLSQLPTSLALPENPHKFFATQFAIFHRISIPPAAVIPSLALLPPPEHRLLRTYHHPPSPPPIITSASSETYNFLNSLSALFLYHHEPQLTLSTIWYSDSPSGTVLRSKSEGRIGGIIEMLLERMERLGEEERDWEIAVEGDEDGGGEGAGADGVSVKWLKWIPAEIESLDEVEEEEEEEEEDEEPLSGYVTNGVEDVNNSSYETEPDTCLGDQSSWRDSSNQDALW
jgi:hypothetical protein